MSFVSVGHINAAFVVVENGSQMASKGRVRIGGGQLTQLQTHRDLAKTRRYMIGWIYWRDLGPHHGGVEGLFMKI